MQGGKRGLLGFSGGEDEQKRERGAFPVIQWATGRLEVLVSSVGA